MANAVADNPTANSYPVKVGCQQLEGRGATREIEQKYRNKSVEGPVKGTASDAGVFAGGVRVDRGGAGTATGGLIIVD
jgi:hypothetical protein